MIRFRIGSVAKSFAAGALLGWFLVLPARAPVAQTADAPDSAAAARADSLARLNEAARRFNARQAALRDSLAAEAEAWHYEHRDMTEQEQIADLNARLLADPRDADLYNNLGVLYAERQDWVLARDAFIAAVQVAPHEADYHRNLALVLTHLDSHDLAVSEFQTYQRLAPNGGPDAWRLMGEALKKVGRHEEARRAFAKGLDEVAADHADERMRLVLAWAALEEEQGKPGVARDLLERRVDDARRQIAAADAEADSTAAEPARLLAGRLLTGYIADANLLMQSDLPAEAAALYAKAFALAPERDDALLGSVAAYLAAGEKERAREVAEQATSAHPRVSGSWFAAGRVAEDAGRSPEAVAAYEKALQLDPARSDVKLRLGNLYAMSGDNVGARRVLGDVVSNPNTPAPVLYNYAVTLIREQKWALALDPLRRTVREDPQMASAWAALGLALRNTEQYAAAADAYRRAISLGEDAKLSYNLGYSLVRAGDAEGALAAYREAVRLDPAFKEAWYGMARALMDAARHDEAQAALEKNLELDPESYQAWFALGLTRYRAGRHEAAIDAYNRALALRETREAFQNMGLAFDKLGRKEEAKRCYDEAKKLKAAGS